MSEVKSGRGALVAGGLAAFLATTCCLGPLVLVTLGVSGAWISNLTMLEPYRPLFIGTALVAMFFAYQRTFRPVQDCKPGELCAIPQLAIRRRPNNSPPVMELLRRVSIRGLVSPASRRCGPASCELPQKPDQAL